MDMIIKRKILTAILSSLLFAMIFSLPDFEWNGFLNLYYLNVMLVLTYGVAASIFSDWISNKVLPELTYGREIISFVLHCFFGLVFFVFSLVSAITFYVTDRVLRKIEIKWWAVILSFLIVLVIFIINIL
ncbi:hypothetical protein [Ureibacillus sinduriensis]|uniref:hypothetical protein n=1 Tax=Ureibacillus sinduriensis TaxID=561440 RepID=UPI001595D037|nr:hypothetical protein [Ureibacillus sinduriensis]